MGVQDIIHPVNDRHNEFVPGKLFSDDKKLNRKEEKKKPDT